MKKISVISLILLFVVSSLFACSPKKGELDDVKYREMVFIPGGTFTQESPKGSNTEKFNHTISAFSIGKYEVTYELWHTVYKWAVDNGYTFANKGIEGKDGTAGAEPTADGKYQPVTNINWRDAIVWCNAYSKLSGLTPVYMFGGDVLKDSSDANANHCDNAVAYTSSNGYRLPTEGEWQYVASNKGRTPYKRASGGSVDYAANDNDYEDDCKKVAWYGGNSGSDTHPVGKKAVNAFGLYDMSGNVWEWCWDLYGDYPTDAQTDYTGASSGSYRVVRGGSWSYDSKGLRVGYRHYFSPNREDYYLGFRVARCP